MLRLMAGIASAALYLLILLPAGFAMLLAYVGVFAGIAGLVIAAIAKLLDPQIHVQPVVVGAVFVFLGAAGIFVFIQLAFFLHARLRAVMLRWTAFGSDVSDKTPSQLRVTANTRGADGV